MPTTRHEEEAEKIVKDVQLCCRSSEYCYLADVEDRRNSLAQSIASAISEAERGAVERCVEVLETQKINQNFAGMECFCKALNATCFGCARNKTLIDAINALKSLPRLGGEGK